MNSRRDYLNNKVAHFDVIEEGRIHASPSYTSHENDRALDGLHDRVNILKRLVRQWPTTKKGGFIRCHLTGNIHEEVESDNRVLNNMGNAMVASRGILSGTMDRFKIVFERKSNRRTATLIATFVIVFLLVYYLTK